jgi:enterochelin esterase-like enzyme
MTTPNNVVPISAEDTVRNRIFVTIDGQDWQKDLAEVGLSFDSSEREIMDRLVPIINEEFGQDIRDYYKIRKSTNNQNIFCIPNSTAGK